MYEYNARIISVYDADTVRMDIDLGCCVWVSNKPCRLFGINAPELRGSEKEQGIVARDALRDRVLGKLVTVKTKRDKTGKYGRLLVDIYLGDEHINQWLVNSGYAVVASY